MKLSVLAGITLFSLASVAHAQKAELPTGFQAGDTWEWRQIDTRTKLEEGRTTRTVVDDAGTLKFSLKSGRLADKFFSPRWLRKSSQCR